MAYGGAFLFTGCRIWGIPIGSVSINERESEGGDKMKKKREGEVENKREREREEERQGERKEKRREKERGEK